MNCNKQQTIKVTEGNAFTLILPLKKRTYVSNVSIDEDIVYADLQDVVLTIGGEQYEVSLGLDGVQTYVPELAKGMYDIILTATYHEATIRAAYFEALSIVPWNYASDAQNYLPGSPIVADAAYIIGGPLTDAQLEELKAAYVAAKQAADEAEAAAQAAKEAYDAKAEQLDDVAQQTTLLQKSAAIIEAIAGIHIDIPDNIATKDDVTAAKQAILDALSHISPEDPNSKALAEFFGVTLLQGYEFMQDTEVTDELEDIMQALDPELLQEVEYPEGSGQMITKAQFITIQAMEEVNNIINPSQS